MTQIMKDLHQGKLDGAEFNPLDEHNTEKMKETLKKYMEANRKGCVDDYQAALKGNKTENDSTQNKAIQAVEQSYMHNLNEIVGTVKANGGPEMKVNDSFPKPTIPYDQTRSSGKEQGQEQKRGAAQNLGNWKDKGGRW
jgi:ATP adenylyltransferase/5',5'''-P-1,P-4-tetraphosphate phosphorylase II